ncbi:1,2-dihydroxy-3-keto-5-methylthiopentene dioxygenase [Neocucurbitaria cava]|uniref:1,2-dihydroxy-3-keto-5-methylthiopentene dioxygenase n=1 Tax=Neocucurbitaria cava TaxID=798079 RepID=A0A9W8Y5H2_9PLEO|nr:1,2-dihydroxy-3-keto-5-methylthiopentene dioxygenase [Neocucurbitaria cava]
MPPKATPFSNLQARKRPLVTKAWTSTDGKNYSKFYLTGPKNHPGLIELEDKDETPLPPKKLTKSSFGDLLAEAKIGGKNIVSPEKKKEDQLKKEEYERTHGSPSPVRLSTQEARWSPEALTTGLPNLQTLQHIGNALKDGTAFRKGVAYRPESPLLPKSPHFQDHFYPVKPPRQYVNSQVSFCKHQDLRIDWDPLDPENRDGSWKPSVKDYFHSASDHDDHKTCPSPNRQQRVKVLAERIIQKFVDIENGKLTKQDRRHGKYEKIIEKKEAARLAMEASDSTKTTTDVKAPQQEQNKKRPSEQANDVDDAELVGKRRKLQKSDVKSGEEFVQAMLQRQKDQKRKLIAPPENRFKPTTMHQRDERKAAMAEKVKRDRAASQSTKEERKTIVPKKMKPSQKTQKVKKIEPDSDGDTEKPLKKVVSKKSVGPKDEGLARKEQGERTRQIKTTKATSKATSQATPETTPKTTPKPDPKSKPREMTAEERALLADITQAGMEAQTDSPPASPTISENEDQEDGELRKELLARLVKAVTTTKTSTTVKKPVRKKATDEKEKKELEDSWGDFETAQAEVKGPQHLEGEDGERRMTSVRDSNVQEDDNGDLAADAIDALTETRHVPKRLEKSPSKKRKAAVIEEAKDEQPKKKARQPKKSAAIIEDSDEDANYALPDASTKLPEAAVRQGWEAEGSALVEEVVEEVHKQEDETVEVEEKENEGIAQAADHRPPPPSSPSNKRKRSPSNTSQEADDTPSRAEDQQDVGAEQPAKRLKSSLSPPRTPSPPTLRISTSSTPPTSTTSRDSPFRESDDDEDANDEDEELSPLSLPKKVKKVKKVSFEIDVTSPVEGKRKMSIPYLVDAEEEVGEVVISGRVNEEEETEQVVEVEVEVEMGEEDEADEGTSDGNDGSDDLDYLFDEK